MGMGPNGNGVGSLVDLFSGRLLKKSPPARISEAGVTQSPMWARYQAPLKIQTAHKWADFFHITCQENVCLTRPA